VEVPTCCGWRGRVVTWSKKDPIQAYLTLQYRAIDLNDPLNPIEQSNLHKLDSHRMRILVKTSEMSVTYPSCQPHPPVSSSPCTPVARQGSTTSPQKKRQPTISSTALYYNVPPVSTQALKRVECVCILARPRINLRLADLFCSHSPIQILLSQPCAAPTEFFNLCLHQDKCELTHTCYPARAATTGGLNDFTLRQVHYDPAPPNRTESSIIMTMYNKDNGPFTRAMQGVMRNIACLCKHNHSKT